MSDHPEYKKLYYCFTCVKYLAEEFYLAHKAQKHAAEIYFTVPNTPKYSKEVVPSVDEVEPQGGTEIIE